ncbi:MAG: tol-pal system YbgF family protein [Phycisphaerales bacterium JB060]
MKPLIPVLIALLAATSVALGQSATPGNPGNVQQAFEFIQIQPGDTGYRAFEREVFADFVLAAQGNDQARQRLISTCERAIEADAQHAEAIAWRGAARMFEASSASSNGDFRAAMNHTNASLADLNRARELEPENPGVRMVAANTLLNLAKHHPIENMASGYAKQGIEDAKAALSKLYDNWDKQPAEVRGQLLLGVAEAYDKLGEATKARDWFNRVIGALPGTTWAQRAQVWIDAADKKASSF